MPRVHSANAKIRYFSSYITTSKVISSLKPFSKLKSLLPLSIFFSHLLIKVNKNLVNLYRTDKTNIFLNLPVLEF